MLYADPLSKVATAVYPAVFTFSLSPVSPPSCVMFGLFCFFFLHSSTLVWIITTRQQISLRRKDDKKEQTNEGLPRFGS